MRKNLKEPVELLEEGQYAEAEVVVAVGVEVPLGEEAALEIEEVEAVLVEALAEVPLAQVGELIQTFQDQEVAFEDVGHNNGPNRSQAGITPCFFSKLESVS